MSEPFGDEPVSEGYKPSRQRSTRRAVRGTAVPLPIQGRELRAQGRKTMGRLLDAGMRVFGERGVHAARVDDIVRAARTSHGTFYLYFQNKEGLLRALAAECVEELDELHTTLGAVTNDPAGYGELRGFLDGFFATYRHYGPVIRAWMEGQVEDREVSRLGVKAFTDIATALAARLHDAGAPSDPATIAALMALLERFAYFIVSRRLDFDIDATLDTVTTVVHRGFFQPRAA
jgi:AcrR family transcriptional regulator